jgi:3'(2'), 5'-bisphosphate nucleotidase
MAQVRSHAMLQTRSLETLIEIAGAAGDVLLELRGTAIPVGYKLHEEPVTAADRRANRLLVAALNEAFPGVPVVAEESEPSSFAGFRNSPRVFFVDPLDGTQEFIRGSDEFAVMIGLVQGLSPIAGVVYAPVARVAWAGVVGVGAWRIDRGSRQWIAIRISATDGLARARIVASRSHRTAGLESALAAVEAREIRRMGGAGLKSAQVAEGLAEAYIETSASTKRWDACAADALVTAAGGRVSDTMGTSIDYRGAALENEHGLVVSNGFTHEAILARLRRRCPATGSTRRPG